VKFRKPQCSDHSRCLSTRSICQGRSRPKWPHLVHSHVFVSPVTVPTSAAVLRDEPLSVKSGLFSFRRRSGRRLGGLCHDPRPLFTAQQERTLTVGQASPCASLSTRGLPARDNSVRTARAASRKIRHIPCRATEPGKVKWKKCISGRGLLNSDPHAARAGSSVSSTTSINNSAIRTGQRKRSLTSGETRGISCSIRTIRSERLQCSRTTPQATRFGPTRSGKRLPDQKKAEPGLLTGYSCPSDHGPRLSRRTPIARSRPAAVSRSARARLRPEGRDRYVRSADGLSRLRTSGSGATPHRRLLHNITSKDQNR
jgi:hypothetical protein